MSEAEIPRRGIHLSAADRTGMAVVAVIAFLVAVVAVVSGVFSVTDLVAAPHLTLGADVPLPHDGEWTGTFIAAVVSSHQLSPAAVALLATGAALAALTIATVTASAGWFFWQVSRGARLRRSLTLTMLVLGIALGFGTLAHVGVTAFGTLIGFTDLGIDSTDLFTTVPLSALAPIGLGLVLVAVAYLLSRGEQLEADSQGLV